MRSIIAEVLVHVGRREPSKELFQPPFIEHVVEVDVGVSKAISCLLQQLVFEEFSIIFTEVNWIAVVILEPAIELLEDIVDEAPEIDFLRLEMELVGRFDAQYPFHIVGVPTLSVIFQLGRAVRPTFTVELRDQFGIKLCIVGG
jgi:hypothetical protein